ncbi:MAG: MurR/RpiR family transcriptional regulator [Beduini sp.]|uniref:MurR/RpiR family transcriptional regulator n=1 Tax=Beduini sp. TaxID=1922300 RepID=UPI0039A09E21
MEQLAYTLLAYINNVIEEDMNYYIAKKFLENIYKIQDFSLEEIAFECNVSSRTINRFCKKIGYHNFTTLKKHVLYPIVGNDKPYYETAEFQAILSRHFDVIRQIDLSDYLILIKMLNEAENIWVIGFEKHQVFALEFQKRLFEFGKISRCIMNYHQQLIDIKKASDKDLIITISIKGGTLTDYNQILSNIPAKKVLLTFNPHLSPHIFDQCIICGDLKYVEFSEFALLRFFDILFYHYKQWITGQK